MLYINKKVKLLVAQLCRLFETPWTVVLCPWDSPGKNTEAGCHFLLQGIFPIQGLNPYLLCLLLWQMEFLQLVPLRKPKIAYGYFLI